jgi:tetratricopeptide (TPR) repeat protein
MSAGGIEGRLRIPAVRTRRLRRLSVAACLVSLVGVVSVRGEGESNADAAPPGRATPEHVLSLLRKGHYAEARDSARVLVNTAERAEPADSTGLGRALSLLLIAGIRNGEATAPATRALADRAVIVNARVHGAESDAVAGALASLALVFNERSLPDSARSVLRRALTIREKAVGTDDPRVAELLGQLGRTEFQLGHFDEARGLLTRVVTTFERSPTAAPEALPIALTNLGVFLEFTGDLHGSQASYERALRLFEERYGPDDPRVAVVLENLGNVLTKAGKYDAARPFYERALALNERVVGPEHPQIAHVLMNLAVLEDNLGDYEAGRGHCERALALQERTLGPTHVDLGYASTTLGVLMGKLGDLHGALSAFGRAVSIREAAGAGERSNLANTLCERAKLEAALGDHEATREDYERSLALFEAAHGPEHQFVAGTTLAYAKYLADSGAPAEARSRLDRALGMLERTLGVEHPLFAEALVQQAGLMAVEGDLAGAERVLGRVVAMQDRMLGDGHPHLAVTLRDLGVVLAARQKSDEALDVSLRAEAIGREHLQRTMRALPERRALEVASSRASGLDLALAMASTPGAGSTAAWRAWDALVRSRAIVLDEVAGRRARRAAPADTTVDRLRAAWANAEQGLANLYVRDVSAEDPAVFRALLDSARAEAERTERALLAASVEYRSESLRSHAGIQEVLRALPSDAALVGYARCEHRGVRSGGVQRTSPGGPMESEYVGFVASAGTDSIVTRTLGSAARIDALAERWRAAVGAAHAAGGVSRAGLAAGDSLRRLVWDPFAGRFGSARRVFVVPDGVLGLVAFGALPLSGPEGGASAPEYVVERGPTLHFLSAERDLVRREDLPPSGSGLLVMGDPDFESLAALDDRKGDPHARTGVPARTTGLFRGERPGCAEFGKTRWTRLTGTGAEVEETAELWPKESGEIVSLTRSRASERAFKVQAPGRSALHIATHGFVVDGSCA